MNLLNLILGNVSPRGSGNTLPHWKGCATPLGPRRPGTGCRLHPRTPAWPALPRDGATVHRRRARVRNIIATRRGFSIPTGGWWCSPTTHVAATPGADDNASGVAVLLELAALLAPFRFERTLQLIGVSLEEARENDPLSGAKGEPRAGSPRQGTGMGDRRGGGSRIGGLCR